MTASAALDWLHRNNSESFQAHPGHRSANLGGPCEGLVTLGSYCCYIARVI
ncbi:hypothetical protein FHT44_000887 [Mycolicibacterium sp. BK634]|nr:hypothetical protein [Mycolicibacterium sp. BK607]MBB3748426.1 hypothetical protein [Mycolicibacterium sp. BK634]TDO10222.1 hypothetical protein EV580_4509 [Mycobacterium sp. BK086]